MRPAWSMLIQQAAGADCPLKGGGMRFRISVAAWLLMAVAAGGCSVFQGGGVYTNPDYGPTDLGYLQVNLPPLPLLPSSYWINASPSIVDSLKGKVVLFDFWDYTCVNCIRTLPYLRAWYKRYSKDGLVIIGVHSPEFRFARKRTNVAAAMKKFGIKYPVVLDNDFGLWKEFGNEAWPEEYLVDRDGFFRYRHIGEGEYGNTEQMIRDLLKEGHPKLKFPALMKPVRPTDVPGAVCYRPTRETYLGYGRGQIGNKKGYKDDVVADYPGPAVVQRGRFYLEGRWEARKQFVRYAGRVGKGELLLNYSASSVNLVARPDYTALPSKANLAPVRVYAYLDGSPVPKRDRPSGMAADDEGRTYITVFTPRMYNVIDSKKFGRHILTLKPASDAFAAYSFTFGTSCVGSSSSTSVR